MELAVSREYVWAEDHNEATVFGTKQSKGLNVSVEHIFAAATTENLPTPPGLETYKVAQGDRL